MEKGLPDGMAVSLDEADHEADGKKAVDGRAPTVSHRDGRRKTAQLEAEDDDHATDQGAATAALVLAFMLRNAHI